MGGFLFILHAMSKYCLILGAKSDIARAIGHRFAKEGFSLYLAGRRKEEMEPDAADLKIRHEVDAQAFEWDAVDYGSHQALYDSLDPKPEIVVSVAGVMHEQSEAEQNLDLALQNMTVNYTGCCHMLSVVANDMEQRGSGTIIGISSVAGDRGRASNYFYGSAKAGFTAFLSGLRNRMAFHGVHVVTVKPGFVYTKMTEGLDLPGPLTHTPEGVANDIYKAWKRRRNVIYTKWFWRYIMLIIRNVPEWKFKKMKL